MINLEDAWPITNAIANPIIPKVLSNSKNWVIKVLVGNGAFCDDDDEDDDGVLFSVKF